jgi:hypothetical protein
MRIKMRNAVSLKPKHLLSKEVLYSATRSNKKAAIRSDFVFLKEPSDGLEPSTPSLWEGPCVKCSVVYRPVVAVVVGELGSSLYRLLDGEDKADGRSLRWRIS